MVVFLISVASEFIFTVQSMLKLKCTPHISQIITYLYVQTSGTKFSHFVHVLLLLLLKTHNSITVIPMLMKLGISTGFIEN